MRIRHGENVIVRADDAVKLDGFDCEESRGGRLIVGHSETGAHHAVVTDKAKLYRRKGIEVAYLVLGEAAPLVHDGQRHKDVTLPAGTYRVSVKRQYNPDGSWSPVAD